MKRFMILLLLTLFHGHAAFAHPHMFFSSSFDFEYDEEGNPLGVWVQWDFDSYFTEDLLLSYDWDENNIFDEDETEDLYNYAFAHLVDYGFYVFIRQGDERRSAKAVENFSVFMENRRVHYRFMISLRDLKEGDFYVAVYDPTYFCEITYPEKNPVKFLESAPEGLSFRLEQNEDYPVYFDVMQPIGDATRHKKWRPGLSTFVPLEVHVFE